MKYLRVSIFILILIAVTSDTLLSQEFSFQQHNNSTETQNFGNVIVTSHEGYYIILATNERKSRLLISKYTPCGVHIWTKKYISQLDLNLYSATLHQNNIAVLAITNFGSSTTRSPIIISINSDGEVIHSTRYYSNRFENFTDMSIEGSYIHIMGPSVNVEKGGGHFMIAADGTIVASDILTIFNDQSGISFGNTMLANGNLLRRQNNTLIATNRQQEIIWAKRIVEINSQELLQEPPLAVEDGFIQMIRKDTSLYIFKMNLNGDFIWCVEQSGKHINRPPILIAQKIGFLWKQQKADGEYILTYTELDQNTGNQIFSRSITNEDINLFKDTQITSTLQEDLIFLGSNNSDEIKNILIFNPFESDCIDTEDSAEFRPIILSAEDVRDEYEVLPLEANSEEVPLIIIEKEAFFDNRCFTANKVKIDTILDCSNTYIFDGREYGNDILWLDGETDSIRVFNSSTSTSVAIEECGVRHEIDINISPANCPCQINAPNIINVYDSSSDNSKFEISNECPFQYYLVQIYDRWGNLVFSSVDPLESWKPVNTNLNQGVYCWILKYKTLFSPSVQIETGSVTLLK